MTALVYVVTVRGLIPESLPRKIAEVHAKALKPRHCSHPRYGKDATPSKPAVKEKQNDRRINKTGHHEKTKVTMPTLTPPKTDRPE